MKKAILLSFLLPFIVQKLSAQSESFDVFKYTSPAGWQKQVSKEAILFSQSNDKQTTFCIMGIYAAQPGTNDADVNFDSEWKRIMLPMGITANPQKETGEEVKGWKNITATTAYTINGTKCAAVLSCFTSKSMVASLLFTFNDASYQTEMESFSNGLDLLSPADVKPLLEKANENQAAKKIPVNRTNQLKYTVPAGWTQSSAGNETLISSPLLECRENSYYTIHVLGTSNYSGDLQEYAHNLHKARFYEQSDWRPYMEGDKRVVKGIDQNGHEFLSYETSAALFSSDRNYHYGLVYLIRSGSQMLSLLLELKPVNSDRYSIPTESLYFTAGCQALKSAWSKFLASVTLANEQVKGNYLPAELLGKWESRIILGATNWGLVDTRIVEQYRFMEDGRFQSEKMFAGNAFGKYYVNGNKLTISTGKTVSYKFKLESLFEYGSWHRELTLYDATGKESILRWEGE